MNLTWQRQKRSMKISLEISLKISVKCKKGSTSLMDFF